MSVINLAAQFIGRLQNIQAVFQTLANEDNQDHLQTTDGTYNATMVEAIRTLKDKVERQALKIEQLEKENITFNFPPCILTTILFFNDRTDYLNTS